MGNEKPIVVCLCGSTRFAKEYREANLRETLRGKIVLTVGSMSHSDEQLGLTYLPEWPEIKERLDELHKRKIDLADEVLILDVHDYIGESTHSELDYAREHGKKIRFFSCEQKETDRLKKERGYEREKRK